MRSNGIDRCGFDLCDWFRNYFFFLYLFTLNNLSLVLSLTVFSLIWLGCNWDIRRWSSLCVVGNLILNRICWKNTSLLFFSDSKISLYLSISVFYWRNYTCSCLFFLFFLLIISLDWFSWYRNIWFIIIFLWYSCDIAFWLRSNLFIFNLNL